MSVDEVLNSPLWEEEESGPRKEDVTPSDVTPSDVTPSTDTVLETVRDHVLPPTEINDDIISISIKDDELPDAVLKAVLLGLAEEQQALKQLRAMKMGDKKDTSHISLKRGTLLKFMSETLIQRQALVGRVQGDLDFKGPKFREVFKMFLQVISDTFDEINIPGEYKDLFFHALSRNLDGWEQKAEQVIKVMSI